MAERLVVFGSGGHAKVVLDAVLAQTPGREVIVLDDQPDAAGKSILKLEVSGSRDLLTELGEAPIVPAIGNNLARSELMSWLQQNGHRLEAVIHPATTVAASADIQPGAFLAAGAIVNAEASIGAGAIVNTGATVDHDCIIGESAHIAPVANLCGGVRIGARTLVGVGASISPGVTVCEDAIIGAGAVVVRDITEKGTYVGNPAHRLQ
jgi:sugar O-acyltransferase (sialic acid O-acetyltransferase NeuD family)